MLAGGTALGWAESYDSAGGARQAALTECRARGGFGCVVRVWGCNGQVIEEGLNLDRAVHRRILTILDSMARVCLPSQLAMPEATTPPIVDGCTMRAVSVCSVSTSGGIR